jgi:peptide/nickel transport system permease protein
MLSRTNLITYGIALLFILTLNFGLPRMMPGDPLTALYGDAALVTMSEEIKAELVERFALDQSIWEQFGAYWSNLLHCDLGYSYSMNAPVSEVIWGRLPWTLLLAGSALVLSTILGILLGIESGWRRDSRTDRTLLSAIVGLSGFPEFFLGMLLILAFGIGWAILPYQNAQTPYSGLAGWSLAWDIGIHMVLPVVTLTLGHLASGYLITRNTMINVLREPYMMTARAKGLSNAALKYRHAGRNSLLPVVTMTGLWLGRLAGGVLFVEVVFSYPGLGSMTYEAIGYRDYPLIAGALLVIAFVVLGANLLVDLSYRKLDPRVRHAH